MCVSGNKPHKNELNYDPLNEIIEIFKMLLNYNGTLKKYMEWKKKKLSRNTLWMQIGLIISSAIPFLWQNDNQMKVWYSDMSLKFYLCAISSELIFFIFQIKYVKLSISFLFFKLYFKMIYI